MTKLYYDYCGWYRIVEHRDGTATMYHTLATNNQRIKIGDYKNIKSAKRALSRYCGGMPKPSKKSRSK